MMHFPVFDHVKIKEMGKVIVKLHQTEDQIHSGFGKPECMLGARSKISINTMVKKEDDS